MKSIIGIIALLIGNVYSHSWIACADYSLDAIISPYNESACNGFARGFPKYYSEKFGEDRGYNYDISFEQPPCKEQYDHISYSSKLKQPSYNPNKKIRLVWPAKNHVSDTCTNPYIPDTQLKLFYHCDGPNFYTSLADFLKNSKQVIDWKKEGNRKGFQNCEKFCENPDKAVCHQDFTMPTLPQNKICTFLWFWEFNPGSKPYTSCWDISTNPFVPTTTQRPSENCGKMYDQCGGRNWKGSTCCREGVCQYNNEWYSQCVPTTFSPPTTTTTTTAAPSRDECLNKLWGQCGGKSFNGRICCPPNSYCVAYNEHYFQCVPKC